MEFQFSYAALQLLGLTMLLPMLVHWAARAIRPAMDRVGGSEGALAVDAMIQSPRRSAATVGALMVGLMFVYSTGAYIQSYKHMIDRWTDQMLNADLIVSTSTLLRSTSYHFSEDLGKRIATLPEVKHRRERSLHAGSVSRRYGRHYARCEMDDFLARSESAILGGNKKTVDDLLPRGEGVLVSKNFAARWGYEDWRPGASRHADRPARSAHRRRWSRTTGPTRGRSSWIGRSTSATGKTTRWTLSTSTLKPGAGPDRREAQD